MKWTLWYDGDYDKSGHGQRKEVWYYRTTKDDPHFIDFSGEYYQEHEPNIVGAVYEDRDLGAKWSATFMVNDDATSNEILGDNHLNRSFDEEGNEHEGNKFVNSLGEYRAWGMECGYDIHSDFSNCADAKKWIEDKWEKWKGEPELIKRCSECGCPLDDEDKCEHCAYLQKYEEKNERIYEEEKQQTINEIDQLLGRSLQGRSLKEHSQHRRRIVKTNKMQKRTQEIKKHTIRKSIGF